MNKAIFFTSAFFFTLINLSAQIPSNTLGLNPPRLKWDQIHTDKVQVIFPRGVEEEAQRVTNIIHYLWNHNTESIGELQQKVSIILHNQTTNSNGFVTVGPFRSEFYLTPPQFNSPTDWLDNLAIHEYRHVQQFGNTRRGVTNVVRRVLGSWPWGGLFGLALPRWYLEGDAVVTETALSATGRGRLPAFNMEYQALVQNGVYYNYEKASAGSLKDFVPDWYSLGYYMTAYARKEYGESIWREVLADAARYKGLFYSFSNSLERRTGQGTPELYEAMRKDLDRQWLPDEKTDFESTYNQINSGNKKTITHYNNPHFLSDGKLVVEKRGYDQIPTYITLSEAGDERRLMAPGFSEGEPATTLSVRDSLMCWAELSFDPRWRNQDFSIIRTYDIKKGKKRKLTSRTKYFAPDLSHDLTRIVAVEIDTDMDQHLVLLNARSGEVMEVIPNGEDWSLVYPRWTNGDSSVVVVAGKNQNHFLVEIDLQTRRKTTLTPALPAQLTHPYPKGEEVYFSAAYTGTNNIFSVNRNTQVVYQLTDVPLGAFQPSISPDGGTLVFSEFSLRGYNIKQVTLDEASTIPFDGLNKGALIYYEQMAAQEGGGILSIVPQQTFEVKKFNKWSRIINPHSILPFADPPFYGVQVLSDNKFSTLSADAGAFYNTNENEWTFEGGLTYAELFPEISLRYSRANRSSVFYNFAAEGENTLINTVYREEWTENDLAAGFTIPLNFTQGPYSNSLRLRANYHRIDLDAEDLFFTPDNLRDTIELNPGGLDELQDLIRPRLTSADLHTTDLRFIFRSFRRRALQHLNPRVGFNLDLRYRTTFNSPLEGTVFDGRADLFLPGLFNNHSFYLTGMYQELDLLDSYRFSNSFAYPRGYDGVLADKSYKVGINYSFPIAYPDWPIGPLAFIKRIKANLFYDHGRLDRGFPFTNSFDMQSVGTEIRFDFRAIRLLEVDLGFRYSYLLDDSFADGQPHRFDFLFISISE